MKVGIKTYSDKKGLEYAKKIAPYCDFIEILVVPDYDLYKMFKDINCEITIHCAHQFFGVDIADDKRHERTKKSVEKAINAADLFNAKHIVIHPGSKSSSRSIKVAIGFLAQFNEKRFRIENLPEPCNIGAIPSEIKAMEKALGCGFCFDFAHACFAAKALNIEPKKHLLAFSRLKPHYFHICGGNVEKGIDHVHLADGNYDLDFFRRLIPKNSYIALETPHDFEKQLKEIRYIKGE